MRQFNKGKTKDCLNPTSIHKANSLCCQLFSTAKVSLSQLSMSHLALSLFILSPARISTLVTFRNFRMQENRLVITLE